MWHAPEKEGASDAPILTKRCFHTGLTRGESGEQHIQPIQGGAAGACPQDSACALSTMPLRSPKVFGSSDLSFCSTGWSLISASSMSGLATCTNDSAPTIL